MSLGVVVGQEEQSREEIASKRAMLCRVRAQRSAWISARVVPALVCVVLNSYPIRGQRAPASASLPWNAPAVPAPREAAPYTIDLTHEYSLAELVDLAEEHNPETQVAWQRAKAAAAAVGSLVPPGLFVSRFSTCSGSSIVRRPNQAKGSW